VGASFDEGFVPNAQLPPHNLLRRSQLWMLSLAATAAAAARSAN
jgi:hypothetical protein